MKSKSVSRKNKSSWRKYIDIKEVEDFLEDQLLEERLGGSFNEKPDDDLFFIDQTQGSTEHGILSKKAKSAHPPRCFQILQPSSSVPDPIKKRNYIKKGNKQKTTSKSSRDIKRNIDFRNEKNKPLKIKKNTMFSNQQDLNNDLWNNNLCDSSVDSAWLEDETNRHIHWNTKELKVKPLKKVPKNIFKVTSKLPAIMVSHPGMSYNPSFTDHNNLLKEITNKEMELIKQEQYLDRVTSDMFSKLTPEENHTLWLSEMSQGIPNGECEEEKNNGNYMAINQPSSFKKKKTLKARRKQKEAKKEIHEKRIRLIEKRKIADIYKLKKLENEITEIDKKAAKEQKKRTIKKALDATRTKSLAKRKYQEPDLEFNRPHEIAGNLRALKPEGNILTDRFYSMQKRNIIEVTSKQFKCHRRKVKKYVKPSHRIHEVTIK